ncbi:MAG: serine hydrolase domain-containing protein [Gemmatimonadota bacterium]
MAADATSAAHASATLAAVYASSGVPGIAAAVSVDGEVVWEEYLGLSDVEAAIPVTPETRFRIGSVSKAVTTVALSRLWQEGRIDLDADVRRYVPEFPGKDAVITPRLLAGHLGGIRNYEQKDFADSSHIDRRHFAETADALAIFADDPLVATPGHGYHYSVFGYTLLSAAMEGAARKRFLSLLDDLVIEPLDLGHTGADSAGIPGRAVAYERSSEDGLSVAEPLDFSYKWAGGGLHSSVRDLARLGSALLEPDFLSPAALALLTTTQTTSSGESTEVGLGWRLGTDSRDRLFIHHAGNISGGRAVVLLYPAQGVSVAITSNQALAPLMIESTAQVLAEAFLLGREGRRFTRMRPVASFEYTWMARGTEHAGSLRYCTDQADDRIDLHPELGQWAARLGSPLPEGGAPVLPMLQAGNTAFIPVITPAGAFAIDVVLGADDSLSGAVSGQYVRVAGPFQAERSDSICR